MKIIDGLASEFLKAEKISVLTLAFQSGVLHSSSMHFAFDPVAFVFYFIARKDSEKLRALREGGICEASLVVGFDEEKMITVQLRGKCAIVEENELAKAGDVFSGKFNGARPDEKHLFLCFTPNWWRYSELKSDPKVFISSEN